MPWIDVRDRGDFDIGLCRKHLEQRKGTSAYADETGPQSIAGGMLFRM
jgi:hypothetical protein